MSATPVLAREEDKTTSRSATQLHHQPPTTNLLLVLTVFQLHFGVQPVVAEPLQDGLSLLHVEQLYGSGVHTNIICGVAAGARVRRRWERYARERSDVTQNLSDRLQGKNKTRSGGETKRYASRISKGWGEYVVNSL